MNTQRRFIVLGAVFVCILCAGLAVAGTLLQCLPRSTSVPDTPVYPNSTLIESSISPDKSGSGFARRTYQTTGSFEDVIKFYSAIATCSKGPDSAICVAIGKAIPFGTYDVNFQNTKSQPLVYIVTVTWGRCDQYGVITGPGQE